MVSVIVDNFKDNESVAVYQLPDGSSILDLKAEIEATEGVPIGHQRLIYLSRDLRDDEDLEFLIRADHNSTIYLCQSQIYLYFARATVESDENPGPYQERTIHFDVDLDEPIYTSLPWDIFRSFGKVINPRFSMDLYFPGQGLDIINLSDFSQPLSYYGICNGDTIEALFGAWGYTGDLPRCILSSFFRPLLVTSYAAPRPNVVRAKYNWDGKIMHPLIQGLPLKRDALFKVIPISLGSPQWLYGSWLSPTTSKPPRLSRLPFFSERETAKGYFPESFVSPFEENTEEENTEDLEIADGSDMLDIPPLPPFQFPPAGRMSFHMPISDKGHSFLKITANYELLSSPIDPTHVTIILLCSTHDIRRVSSVSLFIETPETTVLDVQVCENQAHREEIHIDKEVTESRSRQTHFDGVNIGTPSGATVGFQGGMSRGHSIGSTEKGSRVSRRKVDAGVYNDNTVFWSLKAPTTRLDEDGLTGEESITFVLTKKPLRFKYKCRVTHSKDGIEKTMQRLSRA